MKSLKTEEKNSALILGLSAISTALVCIATMFFQVYVPATRGFFNIGESMVFLSALLFGPFVGALAGGVGSMLADIFLGYPYYAPATLIIKAAEGFLTGFLNRQNPKLSRVKWIALSLSLGLLAGGLLGAVGMLFYSGQIELTVGRITLMLEIPALFWLTLGLIIVLSIAVISLVTSPEVGWMILSVTVGGFTMVLGYFIYEMFFIGWLFGIEAVAVAEVPFNIAQMIIGSIVAVPAAKVIRKFFHLGE
jgi:uncharacterized membrane protein